MATQNILPRYQAEERGAQVNLHPVRLPNPWEGIGEAITNAGQNLQRAGASFALDLKRRQDRLQEREDSLAITEKMNAVSMAASLKMREYLKLEGANAAKSAEHFMNDYNQIVEQNGQGLSPEGDRLYRIQTQRAFMPMYLKMMDHEDVNVRSAQLQAGQQAVENAGAVYTEVGDMTSFNNAVDQWKENRRLTRGGYMEEDELRRGLMEAEQGQMRQSDLDNMQARYEEDSAALKAFKGMLYSNRFDHLMKIGDIVGAQKLYDSVKGGVDETISMEMKARLDDNIKQANLKFDAQVMMADINTHASEDGLGRYLTESEEQAYAYQVERLENSTDPDDKIRLQHLKNMWNARVSSMKTNLASDMAEQMYGLFQTDDINQNGLDITELENRMSKLPNSKMKECLQQILEQRKSAYKTQITSISNALKSKRTEDKNNDFRKGQVALLKMICATNNKVYEDGDLKWDLKNEAQRNLFFATYAYESGGILFQEDIDEMKTLLGGGDGKLRYNAGEMIASVLNQANKDKPWTSTLVNAAMPDLVDDVMNISFIYSNKGKDIDNKGVHNAVISYIDARMLEPAWGKGIVLDYKTTRLEYSNNGIDKDGNLSNQWELRPFSKLKRVPAETKLYQDKLNDVMRANAGINYTAAQEYEMQRAAAKAQEGAAQ